ncbi:MAG: killer suppression protein [Chloroflexi bacterium]|nr:MAG: killer suppression protein [Chloroflexota bacterium]
MDVYFASERLAKLLQTPRACTREFGPANAKWIPRRLDNLRFAANLHVMYSLPGGLHPLHGDRAETFAIKLQHGYRLIIAPADTPPPRKPDGGLDLEAIRSVTVLAVEDYHD